MLRGPLWLARVIGTPGLPGGFQGASQEDSCNTTWGELVAGDRCGAGSAVVSGQVPAHVRVEVRVEVDVAERHLTTRGFADRASVAPARPRVSADPYDPARLGVAVTSRDVVYGALGS